MKKLMLFLLWLTLLNWVCPQIALAQSADHAVVVVAHPGVRKLDLTLLQRIFTGKTVEVDGVRVVPLNVASGPVRQRFLTSYMNTTEDEYVAYWTVRRYVGKGAPPMELRQPAEILDYLNRTPGAIGYLDEADVPKGANIVLRR